MKQLIFISLVCVIFVPGCNATEKSLIKGGGMENIMTREEARQTRLKITSIGETTGQFHISPELEGYEKFEQRVKKLVEKIGCEPHKKEDGYGYGFNVGEDFYDLFDIMNSFIEYLEKQKMEENEK